MAQSPSSPDPGVTFVLIVCTLLLKFSFGFCLYFNGVGGPPGWFVLKTGHNYSGVVVVHMLTLQRRIHFSMAVMPTKSALWVCYP